MHPPRSDSRRRTALIALAAALALMLLAAPLATADLLTPESGPSPNANAIDSLYKIVLYVAIAIFVVVEGTLLWSLVKYRARRGGPEAAQIHGNTPLELGWTVGAALILVVLTAVTFIYLGDVQNPPDSGPGGVAESVEVATIDQPDPPGGRDAALEIDVNGQQFVWRYDYPNGMFDYHELVVPIDTTVVLSLTASDVIHSWWIPKLGGKMDAVPGYVNKTWFKVTEPGVFQGQCAELCGSGHADMRARVRAVQPEQYTAYLERHERELEQSREGLAEQREQREQSQSEIQ
ncbi:MAG: cytochrome c oxidase subunit II [Thermoleophilaceae bacterium]